MNTIRKLQEGDFEDFAVVAANAFPGMRTVSEEDRRKLVERMKKQDQDPTVDFYGLYRQGQLLGGMRLHDFTMQLRSSRVKAGGVGMVVVDLLHKKQKVARDMVAYFLRHYRQQGACMALLYPFRPDFYKKMGFGYGAKLNRYRVRPADLPSHGRRERVRFLKADDKQALCECYARCMAHTNGLIEKSEHELARLFESAENRIVAYIEDNRVLGYAVFVFKPIDPDSFLPHDVYVNELMYETPQALLGLLAFLNAQSDQVHTVVFDLYADHFHYLLRDPRDGSGRMVSMLSHECNTQGLGVMYRVIDTEGLFRALADHNFGGQTCRLQLSIRDSFLEDNNRRVLVHFENGLPRLKAGDAEHEVEVSMDVSDFSSMLMGVVTFRQLYEYSLADLSSPEYVNTINTLFFTEQKPMCTTLF